MGTIDLAIRSYGSGAVVWDGPDFAFRRNDERYFSSFGYATK
jgi:hypothetical protein